MIDIDYIFSFKEGKKPTVALGEHWCVNFIMCGEYTYIRGLIGINLFKFCGYLAYLQWKYHNVTYEQVYSHVISHEHIHNAICMVETYEMSVLFDNLFGKMPDNPKYMYSGIKFNGRMSIWETFTNYISKHVKITFCHTITKHINSIRNKIKKVQK